MADEAGRWWRQHDSDGDGADDTSVDTGVTVNLTATGADGDSDALTFGWMAAAGTLGTAETTGDTSTNTWSAAEGGAYTVSVSVNDGNGGVATDAVVITVAGEGPPPVENEPPAFDGDVTGDVAAPVVGQRVWLSAVATDPEGDVRSRDRRRRFADIRLIRSSAAASSGPRTPRAARRLPARLPMPTAARPARTSRSTCSYLAIGLILRAIPPV
jgi:hypothetical protein